MKKVFITFVAVVFINFLLIYIFGNRAESKSEGLRANKSLALIIDSLKIDKAKIYFFVDKSDYRLTVMSDTISLKSFPVVLGPDPVNDKIKQGDGCTPEGWFVIQSKYPHRNWNKFMWLDYPNKDSWKKHNEAIGKKLIEKNTDIGGEVGIHGVPAGTDNMIDIKYNWTAGCISLKNKDVDEIYPFVKPGSTKVFIQK
ncbi:MAG: L,D-transpeptidase [Bacteroidia bacterium]